MGHIGLQAKHIGLQAKHVGLQAKHIGLQAKRIGLQCIEKVKTSGTAAKMEAVPSPWWTSRSMMVRVSVRVRARARVRARVRGRGSYLVHVQVNDGHAIDTGLSARPRRRYREVVEYSEA